MEVIMMKKMTIFAVALIALCFISGGYALYNNVINDVSNIPTSNSAIADPANPKIDSDSNNGNPITTDISNKLESVSKVLGYSADYSVISPTHKISVDPNFDLNGYVVSNSEYYSFYAPEGYDTTDKFAQCAECGKYFSYGAVTKALPDYAICRGHDDCEGAVFDPNNPNILSYDEVMFYLEHNKAPESVYNRVMAHYGNFGGQQASYSDYFAGVTNYEPVHEPIHTGGVSLENIVAVDYQDNQEPHTESVASGVTPDTTVDYQDSTNDNIVYY